MSSNNNNNTINVQQEQEQISTYIGLKGYSIYKEFMDEKELKTLREDMTVRPYMPKSPIQPPSFPIYRESKTKIYIPRNYGMLTYGDPDEIRITKGDNIDIPFNGEMRDYQKNIVSIYMNSATKRNKEGKELLCFNYSLLNTKNIALNSVFPNGREWSQELLNELKEVTILNETEYKKLTEWDMDLDHIKHLNNN